MKNNTSLFSILIFAIYTPAMLIIWLNHSWPTIKFLLMMLPCVLIVLAYLTISLFISKRKKFKFLKPIKIPKPKSFLPTKIRLKKDLPKKEVVEKDPPEVVAFRLLFSQDQTCGGESK